MRVKTESRRQAIMQAGAQLFREEGFAGASMAMIAARVGGSKATLYNYFSSKDELFAAITFEALQSTGDAMLQMLEGEVTDIRRALIEFGHAFLDLILSPDVIMVSRIAMSHGAPAGLGRKLYEQGPGRGWRTIAGQLKRFDECGLLTIADSKIAALQLKALLEAGVFEPALFGVRSTLSRTKIVNEAVDLFLSKYGPQAAGKA